MSEPEQRASDQQMATPSVSTAPAPPGLFSRVPSHLGRARTSTVVLVLLFVGIFALYLTIKPDEPGRAATSETGTEQPVIPPTTVPTATAPAPETTAEPTTTAPETTAPETRAPTTTSEETTTEEPTDTTVPEETAEPTRPTGGPPTTGTSTPTLGSPPG